MIEDNSTGQAGQEKQPQIPSSRKTQLVTAGCHSPLWPEEMQMERQGWDSSGEVLKAHNNFRGPLNVFNFL